MILEILTFLSIRKGNLSSAMNTYTWPEKTKDFSIFSPHDCHIHFLTSIFQGAIGKTSCPGSLLNALELEKIWTETFVHSKLRLPILKG